MTQEFAEVLRPEFLQKLTREVRKYNKAEKQASKKQWVIARMVNAEWACVDEKFENEINKDYWFALLSQTINKSLSFPIFTNSGETLRRWCNVAASYANADTKELERVLSFEHFRVARSLSKSERNERAGNTPIVILQRTAREEWIVSEMIAHFGDENEAPTDFDRAVGSVNSLQSIKWDFIKSIPDREEIQRLASRIRFLLERNVMVTT